MASYKDLLIWIKAIAIAKNVYLICEKLPKSEQFGISDQMRRSAVSLSLNIAEWYGRKWNKEFIHFLYISRGSAMELETLIVLLWELHLVHSDELILLANQIEEFLKMISVFIKKIGTSSLNP